jgi:anaerobic selenocysteine-containing dehydrogenase
MIRAVPVLPDGRVRTLCRMCDSRCGIEVHIRNSVLADITPAPDNPGNQGRLCPRAHAALDLFYHPDRIQTPLKRTPNGAFEPIGWDQALDEIAGRLKAIVDQSGPPAVGAWKGEGVGFFQQEGYIRRFIRALGSPNYFSNDSVCFNGRWLGHHLVNGFWNPFPYFDQADLILLFGSNPPVCHPPFLREFADARVRGARLVVVDPKLNPIGCWADVYAQPRPGTDAALIWGLIRLVIESDRYDHDFVDRYVVGFEKIAAYAQRFTPEYVEAESGVWADVVRTIGDLIVRNRPRVSLYAGAGLEHHPGGVNTVRASVILSCLAGAMGRPSGLFWPESPRLASLDSRNLFLENGGRPIGADRFPVLAQMAGEGHSLSAVNAMLDSGEHRLRSLLVMAANPAVTNPNVLKVREALSRLDLLVVSDFFLTPTARLAHYVIPGATFLERTELHVHPKYQTLYLAPQVVRVDGIPTGYELWRDLAGRLGLAEWFPWPDETAVIRHLLEPGGWTIDDLTAHPEGIQYAPLRFDRCLNEPLPTPSGKVEFASQYLKNLGLDEIPEYRPPEAFLPASPEFPLTLITGARKSLLYHSRHGNIDRFRRVHPKAEAEMHPDDARNLGLENGDTIRLVTAGGALIVAVRIVHAAEIRPGVIELYHGWEEAPANLLTLDEVNDPISGFPWLKGVPVRVEKI